MYPISLWVFVLKHLQSQGHLLCWCLLFSREQTRYLQEDGGSEIFLVLVSTTEVFLIALWIQNVSMCSPEIPGQIAELCFFNLSLVGAASLEWMTNQSPIFSVWVRTLNVLRISRGSRSALFSISLMGVVFMAPAKARSATFWTLSSLLLLAFEAVAQEVVAYSMMGRTAMYTLRSMFVSLPQFVPASFSVRPSFLIDLAATAS